MKLLKKLAILTCALAAFSFVACDSGSSDDNEPSAPVVDEGGEEGGEEAGGEEAGGATITVAITADESRVVNWDSVYVYVYGDSEAFGGYPGEALKKDETLGIWSITKDVSVDGSWNVIFNDGTDDNKVQGVLVEYNESKLYTHARTWIDWDGTSADTTEAWVAPALTEASTVLAIDVSKVPSVEGKYNTSLWDEVSVHIYGRPNDLPDTSWPGKTLERSKVNSNIFYLVVENGEEGQCTIIFNNNGKGEQLADTVVNLEAGKKYLVTAAGNEGFAEWTDFSLGKLINID